MIIFTGNILDLVLSSTPDLITDLRVQEDLMDSDHSCVIFNININLKSSHALPKVVLNFKKANLEELKRTLNYVPWHVAMLDDDLDLNIMKWEDLFWAAVKEFVPTKRIKDKQTPPWIDAEVKALCRKKDRASYKASKSKSQVHIDHFKSLRREVKKLIRLKYQSYLKKLADDVKKEPKKFWNFYSSKTKSRKLPSSIKRDIFDSSPVTSSLDKANLFNNYFQSVFNKDTNEPPPPGSHSTVNVHKHLSHITIDSSEIKSILANLNPSKSPGPDGIPARLLKETAPQLCNSLTILFNKSLNEGLFPSQWKDCNLTPVHKSDHKDIVTNYRGIALLSIISKALERCVHTRIYDHVQDLLYNLQHAFRAKRSCVTQLLKYVDNLAKTMDSGGQTDIIYLDMAKAFDRVPHEKLLYKLEMLGIRNPLLSWIRDYLSNRRHRVMIEGIASDWHKIPSGVPQGSIIGPIFFLIYINDIANDLTVGTTIPLYADDAKCYREIRESVDNRILQNDLFQIQTWSELWGMGFNTNKCKHLCVTRRRNPLDFTYHIGKHELAKVTQEKDLGVMMNSKLTWHDHVINKVATANKILCIIKRSLGRNNTDTDIIRRLYIHLVRPHLEFASEVWSPHQIFLKDMLEAVQRRATRLMVKNKPYKERLQELNLLSLTSRREYLDLVFLYKCMHNYVDSELPNYLELYDLSKCVYQLRNKKLTFKSISARTNSFKFSFFPRVATAWNDLPLDIRECASLSEFKSKLKKYYIVVDSDKVFGR